MEKRVMKVVIETEEEIIGVKDKNAWTIEDAINLVEIALRKSSFSFSVKDTLQIVQKLPATTTDELAVEDGM
jgi:hypothetical protein